MPSLIALRAAVSTVDFESLIRTLKDIRCFNDSILGFKFKSLRQSERY